MQRLRAGTLQLEAAPCDAGSHSPSRFAAHPVTDPPPFDGHTVRGVVFDLDGTLIDSYGPITASLNHARQQLGMPALAQEDVRRRVGRGLEALIAELVGPRHVGDGVRWFRERYAEVYAEGTAILPGVHETLHALHDTGHRVGVASNKPARFSRPILERLGLAPFVSCIMGPDIVASTKPDPTMILRCLELLGVHPGEAVYVGDMVLDVESAARAGLSVLLVAGGSSTREELEGTGQRLLESIDALPELLGATPGETR